MQLLTKEEINKSKKNQTRELVLKNERLATSLKKILGLQKEIEFDADKAKKVREYQIWCKDIQEKMSRELRNLQAYERLVDDKKEEYYGLVAAKDRLEDKIADLTEEFSRLNLEVEFKKKILEKQYA